MLARLVYIFYLLQFLPTHVQTAPVCGTDSLVNVHVKRTVVEILTTVATVKQTSFYYTTTSTITAPQVEVVISGDLTYTLTPYASSPSTGGGSGSSEKIPQQTTVTTTLSSATSLSIEPIKSNPASNNGGIITSWSLYSNLQASSAINAIASNSSSIASSTETTSKTSQATASGLISASSNTLTSSSTTSSKISTTSSSSTEEGTSRSNVISMAVNTPATMASGAVSNIVPTGLVYSPYNDDRSCRDYDSVKSDLESIAAKSIPSIRVYGNDCNYLSTVLPIAKSLGLKVNQGFWFSNTDLLQITANAVALAAYANSVENGWDLFDYITIGNEAINSGFMNASELTAIIKSIKSTLKDAGYTGYFTTSEPPVTFEKYPELCDGDLIDFVGINPHSYFDADIDASQAGPFVAGQKAIVENICTSKQVVVTETGYPSQGDTNGLNVPSKENQKIAIKSILDTLGSDATLLTFRNDMWKDPGAYNIEQYFGIYDIIN